MGNGPRTKNGQEMASGTRHGQGTIIGADFWEGDAIMHFSVKKGFFSEKGGGNLVNQGLVRISTGKAIQ